MGFWWIFLQWMAYVCWIAFYIVNAKRRRSVKGSYPRYFWTSVTWVFVWLALGVPVWDVLQPEWFFKTLGIIWFVVWALFVHDLRRDDDDHWWRRRRKRFGRWVRGQVARLRSPQLAPHGA